MGDPKESASFSRPENDVDAQRSWRDFQRTGIFSEEILRNVVGDSWRRCRSARVDPSRSQAPFALRSAPISDLLHRHRELLDASRPVLQISREHLAETGTLMVLADANGVVLDLEGDSGALSPAEKIHLFAGASWSEVHCGTNAIGTALMLEQPVQIHSEEHYCEGIKRWTCSATVIRHP
ncbi:MAG: sigma-54-dependent Fis family transcriptional regulator, partial [Gammaproteobacteria bacterium]